jgi:predicted HTH transcriptional regulator
MANQETDRIEYKERLDSGEKLEVAVVAFLNTKGGEVFIGVKDDGSVVGVEDPDNIQTKIANRITDNIKPGTAGLVDIFAEERDGKTIVIVRISSGIYTPYYLTRYGRAPEGAYYRLGSSSHKMTEEMIDRLMEARHPLSLANKVARAQDLKFSQLKIYYEGKDKPLNKHFAQNLGFLMKDDKYNEIAYMFADENRVSIRLARWNGTDKMRLLQNEEFGDTCLITAMNRVIERMNTANITQAKKTMPSRIEKNYVDKEALREVIINAFVHNNYADNGDTPIFEIYDDRFEITSYGDLLSWMSEEDFFTGVSKPRNPEIMRIFKDLEYADEVGSGIPYIVGLYGRDIFRFSRTATRITLKFDTNMEDAERENIKSNKKSNKKSSKKSSKKILDAIAENPTITIQELVDSLGLSFAGIRKNLDKLKKQGTIRRVGPDKGGYWEILTKE